MDLSLLAVISEMHILLAVIVLVLLFGGRKIPELMRGLGEGMRSFKEGMRGDQTPPSPPPPAASNPTEEKK